MRPGREHGEIPPTAGLPLHARDLLPGRGADLAATLAHWTGYGEALVTCSGTAALVVALTTLAQASGRREVVVPAYTCPLVAQAVAHCGLQVRLCDARHDHFEMDPHSLQSVVGTDTLAVVPAHLGGRLTDITGITRIAHAAGARVIEDAAQALGARHADGTPAGRAGAIGIYSLAVGKGLSIHEGGLLAASDPTLHEALRATAHKLLRQRPLWELRRSVELLGYWALYRPSTLGLAYGLPLRCALRRGDLVGAVGDRFPSQIPLHRVGGWRRAVGKRAATRLPGFLDQARARAMRRVARLMALPGVRVVSDRGAEQGTWPFFILLLPSRSCRDGILQRLWTSRLGVSRLFIHALPDYPQLAGIVAADAVPNARDFAARTLTVSNSPWLDEARFERILRVLRQVLAEAHLENAA